MFDIKQKLLDNNILISESLDYDYLKLHLLFGYTILLKLNGSCEEYVFSISLNPRIATTTLNDILKKKITLFEDYELYSMGGIRNIVKQHNIKVAI